MADQTSSWGGFMDWLGETSQTVFSGVIDLEKSKYEASTNLDLARMQQELFGIKNANAATPTSTGTTATANAGMSQYMSLLMFGGIGLAIILALKK